MLKIDNDNELLVYPTRRQKNKYTVLVKHINNSGNADTVILKDNLPKEEAENLISKLEELLK